MSLKRAFFLILLSFLWFVLGIFAMAALDQFQLLNDAGETIATAVVVVGFVVLFLWGCAVWAGAKGYHPLIGIVLGWIGPLGLIVLVLLTDKSKRAATPSVRADEPAANP